MTFKGAPSWGAIRQDVRRELGHGHRADHLCRECERLEGRLQEAAEGGMGRKSGREAVEASRRLRDASFELADLLRQNGLEDLAVAAEKRSAQHHPDRYESGDFDFTGGAL